MFENCIRIAGERLARTAEWLKDTSTYPLQARHDEKWATAGPSHWMSGFFPGCLWYMYDLTGGSAWRSHAEAWTANVEGQKRNTGTHDLGFMMMCSFGLGYRLTGNASYKPILIESAESLAQRYNPETGCIRSWGRLDDTEHFLVIIDNMMNLDLLFWAAKNGGPQRLHDIAVSHACMTVKKQIRNNGSSVHIIDYDVATGEAREPDPSIVHGVSPSSCWSRGLTWALYGFAATCRETRDRHFLDTAERIAQYFTANLPPDGVPYWDFEAPNIPNEHRDVSAAAIGASALVELSTLTDDPGRSTQYFKHAESILTSLSQPPYLVDSADSYAILRHGAHGRPDMDALNPGGLSLIFADYYFLEALSRYRAIAGGSHRHD